MGGRCLGWSDEREFNLEVGARAGRDELEVAVEFASESLGEGEAKADARFGFCRLVSRLMEGAEDAFMVGGWDARARVFDDDMEVGVVRCDLDGNDWRVAGGRVFGGIIDQVKKDMIECGEVGCEVGVIDDLDGE